MRRSRPRPQVILGLIRDLLDSDGSQRGQQGFSLPLVIALALMLLIGGLALANRANQGLFSSIFQNQSWEAREAAEIGMNRIISELNKENNRWLMVQRNGDPDSGIWQSRADSQKVVEWRTNPCNPNVKPDYSKLDPNSATSTTYNGKGGYGIWYIDANGNVSSSSAGATRAYRLVAVSRQPYETSYNGSTIQALNINRDRTDTPTGVGKITLVLEGQSLRNGVAIAAVQLEKEFELVPKCCSVSFGSKHGELNYGIDPVTNTSICVQNQQLGLGLLAGSAESNTGSITLKGKANDIINSQGKDIELIYCIASNAAGCAINVTASNINVALIDADIPKAKEYPINPLPSPLPNLDLANTTYSDFIYTQTLNTSPKKTVTLVDAGAKNLPSYCTNSVPGEINCALNSLSYKNTDVYFLTGSKKIRLYFPTGGTTVVDAKGGNGSMFHCNDTAVKSDGTCNRASGAQITNLSLFGCNISATCTTSNPQVVQLNGNTSGLGLFSYFPSGDIQMGGTPVFEGINWSNKITSNGNPTWVVPGSGVASVFAMMDMIPSGSGGGANSLIAYDFIARATNRYRWK